MKHQLRLCADPDGRSPGERATAPADPPAGDDAGAAGLWLLWELVDLRLSQAGPDSAA
jgi:hypothetical protein